jgi:hypothetical protein
MRSSRPGVSSANRRAGRTRPRELKESEGRAPAAPCCAGRKGYKDI